MSDATKGESLGFVDGKQGVDCFWLQISIQDSQVGRGGLRRLETVVLRDVSSSLSVEEGWFAGRGMVSLDVVIFIPFLSPDHDGEMERSDWARIEEN